MARPTSYSKAILEEANKYLENYKELGHAIPSVEGLCKVINRARSTVYKWAGEKGKEAFSDTLQQINEYQKFDLLNGGLKNELNSNIVKLALGNHGMSDKQEIKANHYLTDLSENELDRKLKRLENQHEQSTDD